MPHLLKYSKTNSKEIIGGRKIGQGIGTVFDKVLSILGNHIYIKIID